MPPLDLRPMAPGPRLLRRLHHRPDGDALAAHPRLLQPQPGRRVPLRALGHRRRQRQFRGLPRPHADHRAGRADRRRLRSPVHGQEDPAQALRGAGRRLRLHRPAARPLGHCAQSDPGDPRGLSRPAIHRPVSRPHRGAEDADLRQGRRPRRGRSPRSPARCSVAATTSARRSPTRPPRTRRRSSRRSATTRYRGSWSPST